MPIDAIGFDFEGLNPQACAAAAVRAPSAGCYIEGLFLDGARWDDDAEPADGKTSKTSGALDEARPRELFTSLPAVWLKPVELAQLEGDERHRYECPVYKTALRAGTLSTTGQSTNFVLDMMLPMQAHHSEKHWIKRGVAAVCALPS